MKDLALYLAERYFSVKSGELFIGDVSVSALAQEYGTPLFVYDQRVLDRKWELLQKTLPQEFSVHYSVKANPNPAIIRYFLSKGAGLEIASGGELYLALKAGCSPERILFAGPGKTEQELELALSSGIHEIHVESFQEIERVAKIAAQLKKVAKISIRINPGEEAQGGAMVMGGKPAQFGIDEERMEEAVTVLTKDKRIEFAGVHVYCGTQILNHEVLIQQYSKALEIARRAAAIAGRPLSTVDFGGGLGIPYFPNDRDLDMESLAKELGPLFKDIKKEVAFKNTSFVLEPGRYLVGEAGVYVTRVIDIKVSRGKKFIVLDGGMNHHLAASGNLGQVIKRNFPVAVVTRMKQEASDKADIVGPLCTPLDMMARELMVPTVKIGDLVGIFQSGAYGRTSSPIGFLSHHAPAEVLVQDSNATLIRRRGTPEDLLSDIPLKIAKA
jgi:diaminopimelate decarboxylase